MVDNGSDDALLAQNHPSRIFAAIWRLFRSVKDALSSGASPKIERHTDEELCSRFIWWSIAYGEANPIIIIGGLQNQKCKNPDKFIFHCDFRIPNCLKQYSYK